jgi:hypothetical protein
MGQCRITEFWHLAAKLNDVVPQGLEPCEHRATELTIVSATRDEVKVFAHVPVCFTHDLVLSAAPGYERTIRLRARPDAAASSPAAGS